MDGEKKEPFFQKPGPKGSSENFWSDKEKKMDFHSGILETRGPFQFWVNLVGAFGFNLINRTKVF